MQSLQFSLRFLVVWVAILALVFAVAALIKRQQVDRIRALRNDLDIPEELTLTLLESHDDSVLLLTSRDNITYELLIGQFDAENNRWYVPAAYSENPDNSYRCSFSGHPSLTEIAKFKAEHSF